MHKRISTNPKSLNLKTIEYEKNLSVSWYIRPHKQYWRFDLGRVHGASIIEKHFILDKSKKSVDDNFQSMRRI